jgi:lycopene cyclase domain-containing protein
LASFGCRPQTLQTFAAFAGDVDKFNIAKNAVRAHRARALPHARNLGNAFQLTNFLRDIHEDTTIARQYVPTELCAKHGIFGKLLPASEGDIDADDAIPLAATTDKDGATTPASAQEYHRTKASIQYVSYPLAQRDHVGGVAGSEGLYANPGFRPLMVEMMELTEELYADADLGVEMLPIETRHVIAVARHAYSKIHDKIREGDFRIFDTRFRVPFMGKLKAAAKVLTAGQVVYMVVAEFTARALFGLVDGAARLRSVVRRYTLPMSLMAVAVAATSVVEHTSPAGWLVDGPATTMWAYATQAFSLDGWVAAGVQPHLAECTYLQFHLVWTIPAAIVVWTAAWMNASGLGAGEVAEKTRFTLKAAMFWTAVLCVVATVYTLPWDDNLVATGVWGYGVNRVRTEYLVLHVPAEEVFFFSIQTILVAGIWLLWFGGELSAGGYGDSTLVPPRKLPAAEAANFLRIRRQGYAALFAVQLFGVLCLTIGGEYAAGLLGPHGVYTGLILVWVTPVLALQWFVGAEALIDNAKPVIEVILFATITLMNTDRWAIRNGIWAIGEEQRFPDWLSAAVMGPDLPIEEASFFLLTTAMCIWGLTLAVTVTLEWRRLVMVRPAGRPCFWDALINMHYWGMPKTTSAAAAPTAKEMRRNGSKTELAEEKSGVVFSVLERVALQGVPVAIAVFHPVQLALTVFAMMRASAVVLSGSAVESNLGVSSAGATATAIAVVEVLRSVRAVHFAVSIVVAIGYLRTLQQQRSFEGLCQLLTTNVLFAFAPLAGFAAMAGFNVRGSASPN